MKKHLMLAVAVLAAVSLTGCIGEQKTVSFDTVEAARGTANENALYNAQNYRQSNVLYSGWAIIPNGDSSQTNTCPQGDGWATLKLVSPGKDAMVSLKCSTVSGNIGCLEDKEFKTKTYAAEDGHCQSTDKVPFPIRKIAK